MRELIKKEVANFIKDDFIIESPKDKKLAHFATPIAFSLAKSLKKSPKSIAEDLSTQISSDKFEVCALNGYINFRLKSDFIDKLTTFALQNPQNFAKAQTTSNAIDNANSQSTMIEYVSANPTGPLHIGHVRGAVFGDTLARVGRYLGHQIFTEYYINDAGNQIENLGISIILAGRKLFFSEDVEYPQNAYKGEYIETLAHEAKDEFGENIFDNASCEKLSIWGKDKMLNLIKSNLNEAGIKIDNYVSEKSLYNELKPTIAKLEKCGGIYHQDNKIWIKSSQIGDEKDRVVVRDDGRPTYLAGDIVYHNNKFERNFGHYINIWGADHHGYIARIRASVHFLGYNENRLEFILMQMVSLLKDGKTFKMSKRAGNFVLMSDVVHEIGSDALRFIFISKKPDTALEFDIKDLKAQDSSNPIFYINYAYARINQVFAKAGKNSQDIINADLANLDENALNLAYEALSLDDVLIDAFESRNLQKIPDFLKNLSANFHKFYNENRVLGSQNEDALLKLFALVALSLKTALNLIGIEPKTKMEKDDAK